MRKKHFSRIILLFFAGFLLQACVPSIPGGVQKGFEYLELGEIDLAKEIFSDVINFSYNPTKKALASEGLGWCYYLEHNFTLADIYFSQAKQAYPAKKEICSGLALTKAQLGEFDDVIDNGLFLLSSVDDILVDYLPDTLYREELLKMLTLSALISNNAHFEDFRSQISDTDFLDGLNALKGGE